MSLVSDLFDVIFEAFLEENKVYHPRRGSVSGFSPCHFLMDRFTHQSMCASIPLVALILITEEHSRTLLPGAGGVQSLRQGERGIHHQGRAQDDFCRTPRETHG